MDAKDIWNRYQKVREHQPLVHCITNYVTVNDCANILLALGAKPTMAHHPLEVAEVTAGCRALVCNLGAMESVEAMQIAGCTAREFGRPWVVDPVGAAGASFRRTTCLELIERIKPTCIRGNFSEIKALYLGEKTGMGVDVQKQDEWEEADLLGRENAMTIVRKLAQNTGSMVVASGEVDLISDGIRQFQVKNGSGMMARITGSGCMSSVVIGAFLAEENSLEAVVAGCSVMGICGEIAEERTRQKNGGTGTFRTELIDAMDLLREQDVETRFRR